MSTNLYIDIADTQLPIVYRPEYNVHFYGLEKLHPFDARKWGRIFQMLCTAGFLDENSVVRPNEATKEDLLMVHTKRYLKSLKCSLNVARIAEIPPLIFVPNCVVQYSYLKPMRYQTGGSILAGKLAMERGWAINIGGGFHHCSSNAGGGFCAYSDISLIARFLFIHYPSAVRRIMIVDLDAHQGNGHEYDFMGNKDVYIMDVYNAEIYPWDRKTENGISRKVKLRRMTGDAEYLQTVEKNLDDAFREFAADIVIYNAGTDVLRGDRLGCLDVTAQGIIQRDELVFRKTHESGTPIVMLTSGGYLKRTAKIVATSILNLRDAGLIRGNATRY